MHIYFISSSNFYSSTQEGQPENSRIGSLAFHSYHDWPACFHYCCRLLDSICSLYEQVILLAIFCTLFSAREIFISEHHRTRKKNRNASFQKISFSNRRKKIEIGTVRLRIQPIFRI